eukprot:GILI01000369.1.p1 GENE.GILI01000369.1~~GILI01000369.1.p1  ORF type:complete len:192 (-),score=56.29 GILI01000369.1:180-692(-)
MDPLERLFNSFCAFGRAGSTHEMENAKFAKFARDCKLLDRSLTAVQVDLIFNRVKQKTSRKINFTEFQNALHLLAQAKYGAGDADGFDKICAAALAAGGPSFSSVTAVAHDSWVAKQTDTSLYTGAHKERFDAGGRGRGIAGRTDTSAGVRDLSHLLDRTPADVRGVKKH